jgi:hypothetical protein
MSVPFSFAVPTTPRSPYSTTRPLQNALPNSLFLAVNLELPPTLDSWGMSVSMFGGLYLIIGDTREDSASILAKGFCSAYTPLDPSIFCKQTEVNVGSFTLYLSKLPYTPTHGAPLPGDCILAINGRPMSRFSSLAQATACFRKNRKLSLLILRHPEACLRARSFLLRPVMEMTHPLSRQYAAAEAAYWVHCKFLRVGVGPPLPPQLKPLVRVVTPVKPKPTGTPALPHGKPQPPQSYPIQNSLFDIPVPTNPLFRDSRGMPLEYCDSHTPYNPEGGSRSKLFLKPVDTSNTSNFVDWLETRKQQWRRNYKVYPVQQDIVPESKATSHHAMTLPYYVPVQHKNPLFRNIDDPTETNCTGGEPIRFVDDDYEYDPDEGSRSQLFLKRIDLSNISAWLEQRKLQWRQNYKVYTLQEEFVRDESLEMARDDVVSVPVDFWTQQGYTSFQHWLSTSTAKWKQSYSWNQRKRKRLEQDSEDVVLLSTHPFDEWLRVRRNQWMILRRRRQRQKREESAGNTSVVSHSGGGAGGGVNIHLPEPSAKTIVPSQGSPTAVAARLLVPVYERTVARPELIMIDAMLEEQQERKRKDALLREKRVDLTFLFDATLGCPDDVITHCLRYLHPQEHGKLLSFSNKTRKALMQRDEVWRQLCPDHWTLPRRPRKPWYELYLTQLKDETQRQSKRWDDLLSQASSILFKGDNLQTIQKLVTGAEKGFRFDVNYSSGVVCERNSLLNLAVIHQRQKVVKWLVEIKNADIESCDRGSFTPLLNAAWAGSRPLVRFLLQKGADRSQVGFGHYTKPLALPDFEGLTAAGWAEKRGHVEISNLIRIGL